MNEFIRPLARRQSLRHLILFLCLFHRHKSSVCLCAELLLPQNQQEKVALAKEMETDGLTHEVCCALRDVNNAGQVFYHCKFCTSYFHYLSSLLL